MCPVGKMEMHTTYNKTKEPGTTVTKGRRRGTPRRERAVTRGEREQRTRGAVVERRRRAATRRRRERETGYVKRVRCDWLQSNGSRVVKSQCSKQKTSEDARIRGDVEPVAGRRLAAVTYFFRLAFRVR